MHRTNIREDLHTLCFPELLLQRVKLFIGVLLSFFRAPYFLAQLVEFFVHSFSSIKKGLQSTPPRTPVTSVIFLFLIRPGPAHRLGIVRTNAPLDIYFYGILPYPRKCCLK